MRAKDHARVWERAALKLSAIYDMSSCLEAREATYPVYSLAKELADSYAKLAKEQEEQDVH